MKIFRQSFLLFLICMLSIPLLSQSKSERDVMEVMRLGEVYWNKGDIDGYVSLYAPEDSCRMILQKSEVYGRENILAFYKTYWPKDKMGKLITDHIQLIKLSKKAYYVTGLFHVTYPDSRTVDGRFSLLMKKVKGKWYYYSDHSS